MTTLAANRFATRGATSSTPLRTPSRSKAVLTALALAASAATLALAPVTSAQAESLNPILGGGIGAVAGAVIGQSIGGPNGAVIGAAVGGAAGVTIANEGARQRVVVQQPVYTRNAPVVVQYGQSVYAQPVYPQDVHPQPVYAQPIYGQPVYVQRPPVYVVPQPYQSYGPVGYVREIRYERYDNRNDGRGEHRGWGEQRFEGRGGDRHRD